MRLVDRIKQRLHRDIVADPVLHGLVLNLYLNGEQYPQRVDDYFPMTAGMNAELADQMRSHVSDEEKHVLLYTRAIEKLGQPVVELGKADVFNEVIRSHTPVSFRIEPADGHDTKTLKLAHFLAHVHFLEKRVARSLEYHVEACAHSSSAYPEKAVTAVLKDEGRHVTYTQEAVRDLLPRAKANEVLALHASAERRANLDFSAAQLRRLAREQRDHFAPTRRMSYLLCARMLQAALWVA
jgi:hypothetical protein